MRRIIKRYFSSGLRTHNTISKRSISNNDIEKYKNDGFVIVRNFIDEKEISLISKTIRDDVKLNTSIIDRTDANGKKSKLSLMNVVGKNVYGAISRSARFIDSVERILDDEVYHYHSKVMVKEPLTGGAWEWHQDYGYWYQNGCLYPTMLSTMVAIDHHTIENGCMQVLRSSHKFGRINHTLTGQQAGADLQFVEYAKQKCELVNVECSPGDVLFFDSLLLHSSQPNNSVHPRWSYIICYNTKKNNPMFTHHHSSYSPLDRWHDDEIINYSHIGIKDNDGTEFMKHEDDSSAQSLIGKTVHDA